MAEPHYAIMRVQRLRTIADLEGATRHGRREDGGEHFDPERTPLNRHWASTEVVGPVDWVAGVEDALARLGATHRKGSAVAAEFFIGASSGYFLTEDGEKIDLSKVTVWARANVAAFYKEFGKGVVAMRLDLDEATPHMTICVVPTYTKITKRARCIVVSYRKIFGGDNKGDARARLIAWQDWYAERMAPLGLQRGVPKTLTNRRHLTHQEYARERAREDQARKAALRAAEERLRAAERLETVARDSARSFTRKLLEVEKALAFMQKIEDKIAALDPASPLAATIAAKRGVVERWKSEAALSADLADDEQVSTQTAPG